MVSQTRERETETTGKTDIWLKRDVSGGGKEDKGKTLPDTGEGISEEGDEGHGFAVVVELKVDGVLRKDSGLVGPDLVEDKSATILRDHTRGEGAVGNIMELGGPQVSVRSVHAARSKESGSCET